MTSIQRTTAVLTVCYTYTHYWYVDATNTQHAPAASEANFALSEQDGTWQLSAITNDHAVPSCAAASNN